MSDLISDEQELATSDTRDGTPQIPQGQRHNRMPISSSSNISAMMDAATEKELEVDISAGQKMLSAVSGSLLTSLLGRVANQSFKKVYC